MKNLLILFLLLFAMRANSQNANQCFKIEKRWDTSLGGHDIQWRITNICNQTIDVQVCYQRPNLSWSCGLESSIQPGATTSWAESLSGATGELCSSARITGSSVRFAGESYIASHGCE